MRSRLSVSRRIWRRRVLVAGIVVGVALVWVWAWRG